MSRILSLYSQFDKTYGTQLRVDSDLYSDFQEKYINEVCMSYQSVIEDILATVSHWVKLIVDFTDGRGTV